MKQLTNNIFVETKWSGANVGCIVTAEGLVMIDTPHCPSDAVVWKKEVASKKVGGAPVKKKRRKKPAK